MSVTEMQNSAVAARPARSRFALVGGVGPSRRFTRMRKEAAWRDQLQALKESRS